MQASSAGRVKVLCATQQAIKKRERGEKRREERERHTKEDTDKNREAHSASFHVFFFGETKELETKREKQRERGGEGEGREIGR